MNAENILDKDGFIKDGAYEIEICDSGLMLDVEGGLTEDGSQLIAFERTNGLNQCFRINHLGNGVYTIVAIHSSKAIGVKQSSDRVQTKSYSLRDDTIKWRIEDVEDNFYKIENVHCGLVLDLEDENWENETPICVFEHHGGDNQKFRLIPKEMHADKLEDFFASLETLEDDDDTFNDILDLLAKSPRTSENNSNDNKNTDVLSQMQATLESMKTQIEELKEAQEQQKAAFMADSEKDSNDKEEILEMPIEDLDITVRTFNCLNRADIRTVGDLIIKTEDEVIKIRNLSKKSFDEVIQKLALLGLSLKKETKKSSENNLVKGELREEIERCQEHLRDLILKAMNNDKRIKVFSTLISATLGSSTVTTNVSNIMAVDEDKLAAALEPFTNPRRIKLLKILMEEELAANEISQATGLVGGQLYHHLQNLENAGLIEKNGDKYKAINMIILPALIVAAQNTKIANEK